MRMLLIAVLLGLISSPSVAANHCGPVEGIVEYLEREHQESPIALAQVYNGKVLMVLVAESGSWTIIEINPNGIACWLSSGQNWETTPQTELPIEGEDISI